MLAGMTRQLVKESSAKINLTLRVDRLRPDGFHEIESLTARAGLCDRVTASARADDRLELTCNDESIPVDDRNLAMRAALALRAKSGVRRGAGIELEKHIPAGAGLGGGSSNAAAVLELLNTLWETALTRDALCDIGSQIGSDVPLFLGGACCVLRGRGEIVAEAPRVPAGWAVLILPPIEIPTPAVYAAWDETGAASDRSARLDPIELLSGATSLEALMPRLFNDLEAPARRVSKEFDRAFARMQRLSDDLVRMTGSGSCMFRLFDAQQAAERFAGLVRESVAFRVEVARIPRE